jgi:hypothetical protein
MSSFKAEEDNIHNKCQGSASSSVQYLLNLGNLNSIYKIDIDLRCKAQWMVLEGPSKEEQEEPGSLGEGMG